MDNFSSECPTLRLVWDATSLNAFMRDPLDYYWRYVQGWRDPQKSIDLLWGTAWDNAMALYHGIRMSESDRARALELVISKTIYCAEEDELDAVAAEAPKDKGRKKNLSTLIRALVWYDAEFGDYEVYHPVSTEPRRAVQGLGIESPCGHEYKMVGNYDEVVQEPDSGKLLVVERKTTTQTMGQYYWLDYDPSVQLNTYDWLASRNATIDGVLLEGCQTGIGFTRFAHHTVYRTPMQRNHWERVMLYWIRQAEELALIGDWERAMNLATQKWESTTRNIERRSPALWDGMLQVELEKQTPWNPMEID